MFSWVPKKIITLSLLFLFIGGGLLIPVDTADAAIYNPFSGWCFSAEACMQQLANEVVGWFNWFVVFGGTLLDKSVEETIVNMSDRVKELDGVNDGWGILRNLANITLIFIILWVALKTILGLQDSQTYQTLAYVIVVGLLMNFSLFFTQVVVDISNIFALTFYNEIVAIDPQGIAAFMLKEMQIQTTYSIGGFTGAAANVITQLLGTIVVFLITGFVFIAASIMLIARFVVLIILMILSPLAFVAFILPKTRQYTMQWFNKLLSEAFWAPLYFVMLYISMAIVQSYGKKVAGTSIGATFQDAANASLYGTIINFIIIIMFFMGSLLVAKSLGASGAGFATKVAGAATFGVAGGATGWAGRNTLGRGGQRLFDSEKLKAWESKGGVGGYFAGKVRSGASKTAQSSFDVRSAPGVGNVAKAAGMDLGVGTLKKDAGKGGFRKAEEDQFKKDAERAKSLAPSQYAKDEAERKAKELEENPMVKRADEANVLHQAQVGETENRIKELKKEVKEMREIFQDEGAFTGLMTQVNQLEQEKEKMIDQFNSSKLGVALADTRNARKKADNLSGVDEKKFKERLKADQGLLGRMNVKAEDIDKTSVQDLRQSMATANVTKEEQERKGLVMKQTGAEYRAERFAGVMEQTDEASRTKSGAQKFAERAFTFSTAGGRRRRASAIRASQKKKSGGDALLDLFQKNPELQQAVRDAGGVTGDQNSNPTSTPNANTEGGNATT